jgi:hypothetical protein
METWVSALSARDSTSLGQIIVASSLVLAVRSDATPSEIMEHYLKWVTHIEDAYDWEADTATIRSAALEWIKP